MSKIRFFLSYKIWLSCNYRVPPAPILLFYKEHLYYLSNNHGLSPSINYQKLGNVHCPPVLAHGAGLGLLRQKYATVSGRKRHYQPVRPKDSRHRAVPQISSLCLCCGKSGNSQA